MEPPQNLEPIPPDPQSVVFNIEKNLRVYVPCLFELLDPKNISQRDWNKINKKVKSHSEAKKKQFFENNNYLKFETNLYDIIIAALLEGHKPAWAFPTDLFKYHQLYKAGKVHLPDNVHEPFAYVAFSEEDGGFDNRFLRISHLFTSENIEIVKH